MVQPQPDGPMQWDMSGEESGGTLRVPPELAANEVVTRLLSDNQQLRGRACSEVVMPCLFLIENIRETLKQHLTMKITTGDRIPFLPVVFSCSIFDPCCILLTSAPSQIRPFVLQKR